MALTLHQHGFGNSAANNASITVGAISSGDCIVVFATGDDGGNAYTISDGTNPSGNYVQKLAAPNAFGAFGAYVYVLANSAAIANATITATQNAGGSGTRTKLIVHVWSGADSVAPFDVGAITSGTSAAPSSGATATVSGGNEVAIGFMNDGTGHTFGAGSGYTIDDNDGTTAGVASEHQLLSPASGTQTATFTINVSDSFECAVVVLQALLRVGGVGGVGQNDITGMTWVT